MLYQLKCLLILDYTEDKYFHVWKHIDFVARKSFRKAYYPEFCFQPHQSDSYSYNLHSVPIFVLYFALTSCAREWLSGNGLDLHSEGARFVSPPGHRLSWLMFFRLFFQSFQANSNRILQFSHDRLIKNPFQSIVLLNTSNFPPSLVTSGAMSCLAEWPTCYELRYKIFSYGWELCVLQTLLFFKDKVTFCFLGILIAALQ
jgi:hypothetical protein